MAIIQCAISGLKIQVSHVPMTLTPQDGYYHPIFALPYKKLYGLYSKHCTEQLTPEESYLLFLAFLNSTDKIAWYHHATCKPRDLTTRKLIENNLAQLIKVIELTNLIQHPSFKQPSFSVNLDNSKLLQIPNWINAWEDNIKDFHKGISFQRLQEDIVKIENKLSYCIKSSYPEERYTHLVANWADKTAGFPANKSEEWKAIIRASFNKTKMFHTPLTTLHEIKNYCTENIEQGSIFWFTLMSILNAAINKHSSYLGIEGIDILGYAILPNNKTQYETELERVKATAPINEPKSSDYPSHADYIKAKLKYRVSILAEKTAAATAAANTINITGKDTKL